MGGSSKSITVNDKEFIEKSEESIDAIKFINQVDWEKLDLMQKMEFCQELTDMLSPVPAASGPSFSDVHGSQIEHF